MKKYILFAVTIIALTSCGNDEKDYDATGTFEATEITVSAEQNGKLLWYFAKEGTTMKEGQQVGLIDTVQLALKARQAGATSQSLASQRPDISKQIAATRQELAKAEQEQARYAGLVKDGAANHKLLDDATSTVKVLSGQLAAQLSSLGNNTRSLNSQMNANDIQRSEILDQLAKCHITAPITGTVLENYTEIGEFATVGKPLFKIADVSNLYLRAYITSKQLEKVKLGQKVRVMTDYGDNHKQTYDGTVSWISEQSEFTPKTILTDDERADLVYAVKIAVKNDGYIKIGMYGEVKL